MTPDDIINETRSYASEWIEMSDNPDRFISGLLANRIIKLNRYINYLEKRLKNVSQQEITNNSRSM